HCSCDSIAYRQQNYPPPHLTFINHTVNKRQGGARNTGMRIAKGEYIVFIDQDDSFADGALGKVRDYIKANPGLDIVMYDFELINSGDVKHDMYNDSQEIMSGRKFIQTQQIPWCPWCYAYRRGFMLENDIFFEENVRFEDTDFTIRSTIAAKKMAYIPVKVVKYLYWEGQTCKIGEDFQRIYDYFKMSRRIRAVGENVLDEDQATAKAVMGHHHFMHKANIQRYLWRLPFKQKLQILRECRAYTPCSDRMLSFSSRYPLAFACILQGVKPLLPIVRKVYLKLKK
ncbi:MAG: glycosyltransferase, partial [Bacteroides sp.]|nr:glycosyltransferase [Bacteroides sp.]